MSQNILLNTQKIMFMVVDKGRERKKDFVLGGEKIEEVECFVYLALSTSEAVVHRKSGGDWSWSRVEHGVDMEEQRYEFGTQSEVP